MKISVDETHVLVMGSTVKGKPTSNSFLESACFFADLLWFNVKPRWRAVTSLFWITFPIFLIAAFILEVATTEPETRNDRIETL